MLHDLPFPVWYLVRDQVCFFIDCALRKKWHLYRNTTFSSSKVRGEPGVAHRELVHRPLDLAAPDSNEP